MNPMELDREIDRPRLAAWRAFLVAHARIVEAIERDLAEAGSLPLSWYEVLIALGEAPDRRLRMHELADAVLLSPSGLSRLVDRLEARGLLERQPCSEDRRCQFAVLTETGLDALRRAWPTYTAGIAGHFGERLSDAEVETLRETLNRLVADH
ncbi:MAG: MarR family winged helix-turn-helix transcriptional regulator [Gemmatimonadota bacterium]